MTQCLCGTICPLQICLAHTFSASKAVLERPSTFNLHQTQQNSWSIIHLLDYFTLKLQRVVSEFLVSFHNTHQLWVHLIQYACVLLRLSSKTTWKSRMQEAKMRKWKYEFLQIIESFNASRTNLSSGGSMFKAWRQQGSAYAHGNATNYFVLASFA